MATGIYLRNGRQLRSFTGETKDFVVFTRDDSSFRHKTSRRFHLGRFVICRRTIRRFHRGHLVVPTQNDSSFPNRRARHSHTGGFVVPTKEDSYFPPHHLLTPPIHKSDESHAKRDVDRSRSTLVSSGLHTPSLMWIAPGQRLSAQAFTHTSLMWIAPGQRLSAQALTRQA